LAVGDLVDRLIVDVRGHESRLVDYALGSRLGHSDEIWHDDDVGTAWHDDGRRDDRTGAGPLPGGGWIGRRRALAWRDGRGGCRRSKVRRPRPELDDAHRARRGLDVGRDWNGQI